MLPAFPSVRRAIDAAIAARSGRRVATPATTAGGRRAVVAASAAAGRAAAGTTAATVGRLDVRKHDVGIGGKDAQSDLAFVARRKTLGQLGPGLAAVDGLVDVA